MENIFVFLGIIILLIICHMIQQIIEVSKQAEKKPVKKVKLIPDLIKVNGKTTKVLRTKKGTFAKKKITKK